MMNKKRGLLVLCMILLLGSLVSAIPQTFSVHGKLENNAGSPLEGTYNMSFNIYTTYTGGSASWTLSNQDVTTDSNGIYNIVLTNVNLDFGSQYYLGVTVGNDSEMSPRINLTSSPYAFEAQNVSVSGVRFNSNVDFGTNYNFTFDGGTLFVDGSNGYVGIGTTSPQAILHTQTTGTGNKTGLIVGRNTANTNDISSIVFNSADLGDQGAIDSIILSGSTADLAFRTRTASALTEKVRITTTGYVGIGTTNPTSKLGIKDTATNGALTSTLRLWQEGSGSGTGASIELGFADNSLSSASIGGFYDGAGRGLSFNTALSGVALSEKMRITSAGYVGIGTTTPQQKLHVNGSILANGTINATTDLCIQGGACLSSVSASAGGWTKTGTQVALTTATDNVSIGSTDFFVDNSKGYVGIGTTSPATQLHVVNRGLFDTAGVGTASVVSLGVGSENTGFTWNTGNALGISTNGGERIRIDNTGSVGIGTTSPGATLDINGANDVTQLRIRDDDASPTVATVNISRSDNLAINNYNNSLLYLRDHSYNVPLYITDNNFNPLFIVNGSGNVGIGTTSPGNLLTVGEPASAKNNVNATLKIQGMSVSDGGGGYYGSYGGALLSATNEFTNGARMYLITNALGLNKFAIIRSADVATTPTLGTNGVITSGTADFVMDNTGNVGIGTTAPTKKFEVNGTAGAFNVNPDNAGGPLLNTTSGNVTITSAGGSFF